MQGGRAGNVFKSPSSKGAFPASTENIPHIPVWPAGVVPAVGKEWAMCQILKVLLAWITLGAIALLVWSEWMPGKPAIAHQPKPICSHRIPKIKLLLTEKNPFFIQRLVFMICFKGAPPSFSPILSYLFNNLCSFCILYNEGGNNSMSADSGFCSSSSKWKQQLIPPVNIYLCYVSFSSLAVYSQEKVRKWKGLCWSFRHLFMNRTFLDT